MPTDFADMICFCEGPLLWPADFGHTRRTIDIGRVREVVIERAQNGETLSVTASYEAKQWSQIVL